MNLYLEIMTRIRVYKPDDAPDDVRNKAIGREHEGIQADELAESVFGTCDETGLRYDESQRGILLETSGRGAPTWSIGSRGEGAALTGSVVDVDKFLAFLESEGKLTRHEARRLRYVEQQGGISLRFGKARAFHERTQSDFDAGSVDDETPEIYEAIVTLRGAWSEYVRDLESRALAALNAELSYLTSWEVIAERLDAMGEGIDENGWSVPLADCKEVSEDDTEGDE